MRAAGAALAACALALALAPAPAPAAPRNPAGASELQPVSPGARPAPSRSGSGPARRRAHLASRGPGVTAALSSLVRSGAITEAVYSQDSATYLAAKRSLSQPQRDAPRQNSAP